MHQETSAAHATAVAELVQRLRGTVLRAGDAGFPLARRVWNAAIDRQPVAVLVCADAEDVALALRIAAAHGAPVTVRSGGHNVAGRGVGDGALLIDLTRLRQVEVNAAAQLAIAQGGAQWHDLDLAGARHGLATTGGMVSSTGVGGLTLGGGTGWLMRRDGLAIDNLLGAGVVLGDGRVVRASAEEHDELFYGLRGGGGGLGVVTHFEFRLRPQREVLAGLVIREAREAADTLRVFRDFVLDAPDEFCGMVVLVHAPALPFLDAAWHGRAVCITALCWSGDRQRGECALEPLRRFGTPLADHVGPMPYLQWQHLQDPGAPPGRHHYWKTASYPDLGNAALEVLAAAAQELPSRCSEIHVQHLGGAVARVPEAATAFSERRAQFFVNLIGTTPWAEELPTVRTRVRQLHARLPRPLAGRLPNFTDADDGEAAAVLGADAAARMAALRRRYDPHGLFAPGRTNSPA